MKFVLDVELPDDDHCFMCPACRETGRSDPATFRSWITFECKALEEDLEVFHSMPLRPKGCPLRKVEERG